MAKDHMQSQKKLYAVLLGIMLAGFVCGLLYITLISKVDKSLVKEQLSTFFQAIKTNQIDTVGGLQKSILGNTIYCVGMWILGMSIIGLPVICACLFMKAFSLGFSISSILSNYGFKGLLGVFTYTFPQSFLSMILCLLISFYAVSFSIKLFKALFLKKTINFKEAMQKYCKILGITWCGFLVTSLLEVYLAPQFMKLFTMLLK